jgi:enoyl-[acyl-carrier protein] reductase I
MPGIMQGKRGLIMGVANGHSIAWGIARELAANGAELAFTYQGDAFGKRVAPLAKEAGSEFLIPCDVEDIASVDAVFEAIEKKWGGLDFVVHAIGFSDKNELKGRYVDVTTRENFSKTMVISAYSFTEVAQRAGKLMKNGGSLLTLTYGGSMRVMPNYNVMGVAKAALEAMVRYLARAMFNYQQRNSPLRRTVGIEDVGRSALYLLSDMSSGVTGEIHYVDSGYNIVSMPIAEELKKLDA